MRIMSTILTGSGNFYGQLNPHATPQAIVGIHSTSHTIGTTNNKR